MQAVRALAAVVLLLAPGALSGCSGAPEPEGAPPTTLPPLVGVEPSAGSAAPAPTTDPALAALYDQHPAWAPCSPGERVECARLRVPVDWSAPGGAVIDLALARVPAPAGERRGSLVLDPGGPGASGVDWVRSAGAGVVGELVAARTDLVAFDPRGAGASAPIRCLDDAGVDAVLAGTDPAADGLLAAACAERGGPLLAHVDVASVARDLDVLRAALGEERLHYLGKSWGTLLGATYAGLFPERVGRFVLDGALDPAADREEVLVGQARGLEASLGAYLRDCAQRRSCPLDDDPAAAGEQVAALLGAVEEAPLPAGGGRVLTASLAFYGLIAPLYDDAAWPRLDEALALALGGEGRGLLALADAYWGRRADGTYASNLLQVFTAVDCLDSPVDPSPQAAATTAARLREAAPVLAGHLSEEGSACAGWPVPPVRTPAPVAAEGAPPILVVGTTGDPATPYPWARSLADQLEAGRLLTWEGEDHTAYRQGSACVDAAVDAYLLDGVLPGEGATCTE